MLLERDDDLAVLEEALRSLRDGHGGVVGVTGPVGAGRSALLDAFALSCATTGEAAPVRVVRATAVPAERDEDGALTEALLDDLHHADGPPSGVGEDDLLAAVLGVGGPLVLVVDDLQHADAASLRALGRLAAAIHRTATLLVLATVHLDPGSRGEDLRALWSHVAAPLVPAPLSRDAVEKMVRAALPDGTDDDACAATADDCRRRTGGRALFVVAELAGLESAGMGLPGDGAWLADRLRAPVETLPPEQRRTLDGTVVLRGHADLEGLAELVDLDEASCAVAVEALVALGLLTATASADEPVGAPAHPAVATVVEDLLGVTGRTQRHAQAAALTHRRGAPARVVADHLLAAGARVGAWEVAVLREAAADTWRSEGPEGAARALREALVHAPPAESHRGPLLLDLAEAEREFDPAAALLHVLQAADLLTDPLDRAAAYSRLAPATLAAAPAPMEGPLGDLADELERRAVREPGAAAAGSAAAAAARIRAREWYIALDRPARLRAVADRLGGDAGDPRLESTAGREQLAVVLHAAVLAVDIDAAETDRRARRILDREAPDTTHVHSGVALALHALVAADHVDGLETWLAEAATAAADQGCPVARCVVAGERAVVAVAEGRLTDARRHLDTVATLFDPRWNDDGHIVALSVVPVAAALDAPELSGGLLAHLRRRQTSSYAAAGAAYAGARDAMRRGDPRRAADHFRTAGTLVEESGWVNPAVLPWRVDLATALHEAGEERAALDVLAEEHVRAEEWGAPVLLGRVHRVRGEMLGGSRGRTLLGDAVDVFATSCNAREAALASLALGRLLAHEDDPAAEGHLAHARTLARSCGDAALAAAATSGTPAGVPGVPPDPSRVLAGASGTGAPAGPALTLAERRVAELAVEGRTNGEIAEALGISVRGVEKHLTRCYRKTGARGRADLADRLPAAPPS